jgi:hypothetical protein
MSRRLLAIAVLLVAFAGAPARAENCSKSREYLLGGLGGDLVLPPQAYENLFKICIATSAMANVKDAYILNDGGIAVVPKQDNVAATAATLSQFCDSNPKATLRFLTRKDMLFANTLGSIVQMSSTSSTSCQKIKGTF